MWVRLGAWGRERPVGMTCCEVEGMVILKLCWTWRMNWTHVAPDRADCRRSVPTGPSGGGGVLYVAGMAQWRKRTHRGTTAGCMTSAVGTCLLLWCRQHDAGDDSVLLGCYTLLLFWTEWFWGWMQKDTSKRRVLLTPKHRATFCNTPVPSIEAYKEMEGRNTAPVLWEESELWACGVLDTQLRWQSPVSDVCSSAACNVTTLTDRQVLLASRRTPSLN